MTACIFCRILKGEIPATVVHRDDDLMVFRDVNPQAPVHLLIIPTRHLSGLSEAGDGDQPLLGKLLLAARDAAAKEGLDRSGYRVVTNVGASAGQSVFHLHVHVLGGRAMTWPPG